MFSRRTMLYAVATLALFALTVTAGKGGKPKPPPPPPSQADPAILYTVTPGKGRGDYEQSKHEIWVMNDDGSNQTPIITYETHGLYPSGSPQWSDDNTRFVFRGRPVVVGEPLDLYVSEIDGSNVTRVLDGDSFRGIGVAMDWLPGQAAEDEWIIFSGWLDEGNREDLYAIRSDGTGLVQLTNTPERYETWPCVSPDGTFVVYRTSYDTGGYSRVYRGMLGTDGGVPVITGEECLTDIAGTTLASRNCFRPRIDPTGTYVLLRTGSPNNYRWLVPLANPAAAWRTPIPPERGGTASWLDPDTVVYEFENSLVKTDVFSGEETIIASFGKTPVGYPTARRWDGDL